MAVQRIENFNLSSRHLISGIYGSCVDDIFIDSDLGKYDPMQAFFLSFKKQGYRVVFYSTDSDYNFYSYSEDDLADFYELTQRHEALSSKRHIAQIDSPFGNSRRAGMRKGTENPIPMVSHYEQIQIVNACNSRFAYYRIRAMVDPFDVIVKYARNHKNIPTVVVFPNALTDTYENVGKILKQLDNLKRDYDTQKLSIKLVAYYNSPEIKGLFDGNEQELFRSDFIKKALLGSDDENQASLSSSGLYCLQGPLIDEFRNLLNRKRLLDGVNNTFCPITFDRLSILLSQKVNENKKNLKFNYERISSYESINAEKFKEMINTMDTQNSFDRLRAMSGIDDLLKKFECYISDYRNSLEPGSPRFRPHMVFLGNPGTGKTTVAKCFADVLREEGLLNRGHLIVANVADMEGQYIGETRIKTQALCERARGGILFIDEAYGLMDNGPHGDRNGYGKEAIEVLIQFMENETDSLVILAGYKDEVENLIKNGNVGFKSRIQRDYFFHFKDYEPDALYHIFSLQLKGRQTSDEFNVIIRRLISTMYSRRNSNWGNAREMENLASSILNANRIRTNDRTSLLEVDDIPKECMKLITHDSDALDRIKDRINQMIGLKDVKMKLQALLQTAMGKRIEADFTKNSEIEKEELNFIFMGNPGTGKTTVARMMGEILSEAGILEDSDVVQYKVGDIVQAEVGGTAKTIDRMFKDNSGKVIFIDEAYELATQGKEAITPITDNLFDERYRGNQAFILAGYTNDMQVLLSQNRGLRSRFTHVWVFEDYSDEELWIIFRNNVNDLKKSFTDEELCHKLALHWFAQIRRDTRPEEFGNARLCGKNGLLGLVNNSFYARLMASHKDYASVFVPEDFPNYSAYLSENEHTAKVSKCTKTFQRAFSPITVDVGLSKDVVKDASDFINAVGLLTTEKTMGTSFVFSLKNNYILTTSHVVEDADEFSFIMHSGEFRTNAVLVWNDYLTDMAILQVDELPETAKMFVIDTDVDKDPETLEEIIHCGYVKGENISKKFNTFSDRISCYEPDKQINNRHFDTIMSSINAAEGCSGGPVFRSRDMKVIGILQGGFSEGGTRIITDIHQLIKLGILNK